MQYLSSIWGSGSSASGPSPTSAPEGAASGANAPVPGAAERGGSSPRVGSVTGGAASSAGERWSNPLREVQLLDGGHSDVVRLLCRCGDLLVSAADDGRLVLWDPTRAVRLAVLRGHTQKVTALLPLPAGRLASASCDRAVRLWQLSRDGAECLAVLQTHAGAVLCLAALPGGGFVSGGSDRSVCVWSATGELEGALARVDEEPLAAALAIAHPLAGQLLVCANASPRVQVYSLTERAWRRALPPHHRDAVQSLCGCGDAGAGFASGALDGSVVLWRACPDAQLLFQPVRVFNLTEPYMDGLLYLHSVARLTSVGPFVAAAIGTGFAVYDSRSLACVVQQQAAHAGPLTDVVSLYEGSVLATAAADGTIKLWATRPAWSLLRDRPLDPNETPDEGLSVALKRLGRSRADAVCLGELLGHSQAVNALLPLGESVLVSCADASLAVRAVSLPSHRIHLLQIWRDRRQQLEVRHAAVLAALRSTYQSRDAADDADPVGPEDA